MNWRREKPKPEFHFKTARTPSRFVVETEVVIGYEEPLSKAFESAGWKEEKRLYSPALTESERPRF